MSNKQLLFGTLAVFVAAVITFALKSRKVRELVNNTNDGLPVGPSTS